MKVALLVLTLMVVIPYLNDLHPHPTVCLQHTHFSQYYRLFRFQCLYHEDSSHEPRFLDGVVKSVS
jgi:hypothetical protein